MASFTPQNPKDILLKFAPGTYSPYGAHNITLDFAAGAENSSTGNLGAALTVLGLYQNTTYTYLKYCPTYVIGYTRYGIQILKGRCVYGGIRDIGANVHPVRAKEVISDLSAFVGVEAAEQGQADLPATITSYELLYLTANISGELPVDLPAKMRVWQRVHEDLPAYIRGWQAANLAAQVLGVVGYDLPASISPIPPSDLPAYLKVWPQEDLPANLRAWDTKDLSANIGTMQDRILTASIGGHLAGNLGARLKGWAREVPKDLSASVLGFAYQDLPAVVRATYLADLPANLFAVAPKDLPAYLHGYQASDLGALINGIANFVSLPAYIFASGGYKDLPTFLVPRTATEVPYDLVATISSWYSRNLPALINAIAPSNLPASLTAVGGTGDLPARLYPKMVRLTNTISFVTMESLDLSAVVNICGGSGFKNLVASLAVNHIKDLPATIVGQIGAYSQKDLPARTGYYTEYSTIDKLPISIIFRDNKYRTFDKYSLMFSFSRQASSIWASIVGEYTSSNLPASLRVVELDPYNFENTKNRERVYFGLGSQQALSYETVEISFREIVSDYFFISGSGDVYKTNPLEKWVANMSSFIPRNNRLGLKRRLHKDRVLYDIEKYTNVDEAVRNIMEYITSYPQSDLGARIASKGQFNNLTSSITVI